MRVRRRARQPVEEGAALVDLHQAALDPRERAAELVGLLGHARAVTLEFVALGGDGA